MFEFFEIGLSAAIIVATIFWFIDNYTTFCERNIHEYIDSKSVLAFIKWSSVALLILISLDFTHYLKIIKSAVLFSYSIGDVIIIWKETYSILFFMLGHSLLITHAILKDLWEHIFIDHIGLWLWVSVSIFIGLISSIALKIHRTDIENNEFILYVFYIFTLVLILFIPTLVSKYLGTIFFVMSDIVIGFKISALKKITFPLYFLSLILILSKI